MLACLTGWLASFLSCLLDCLLAGLARWLPCLLARLRDWLAGWLAGWSKISDFSREPVVFLCKTDNVNYFFYLFLNPFFARFQSFLFDGFCYRYPSGVWDGDSEAHSTEISYISLIGLLRRTTVTNTACTAFTNTAALARTESDNTAFLKLLRLLSSRPSDLPSR